MQSQTTETKAIAENKPKKLGRPTKYKPEYCQQMLAFFDREPHEIIELEHYDKEGNVKWIDKKKWAATLPTFSRFARSIGVYSDKISKWAKKYPDFHRAYMRAKELQKDFLIENGLNGGYNPAFAIFTAKNITDMKDQQEVKIDGNLTLSAIMNQSIAEQKRQEAIENPEPKQLGSPGSQ